MKEINIDGNISQTVVSAMSRCEFFNSISNKSLSNIAARAVLCQYEVNELIVQKDEPTDSFFLLMDGEIAVLYKHVLTEELIEVAKLKPYIIIGEIGLLLDNPRTATIKAVERVLMLKFDSKLFSWMFEHIPTFGPAISRNLARRVQQLTNQVPLPNYNREELPENEVLQMLPMDFIIRHRVLPLNNDEHKVQIGFVNDPTPTVLNAVRRFLSGMELNMVRIENQFFDNAVRMHSGIIEWTKSDTYKQGEQEEISKIEVKKEEKEKSLILDQLLKRMISEGASDIHLSAGHSTRWRIDGDLKPIEDTKIFGKDEVLQLLKPVMDEISQKEFAETYDCDFVYPLEDIARFRVNLFRDDKGISSVLRHIPSKILTFEQLNLPVVVKKLCEQPKGMVLVTGPTGSGKSTTLAAMIDYINKTRYTHIITLEDPIEFSHKSNKSLINQREPKRHTKSFSTALRAALREDPDIVLVGEMRDLETIALALETANTGHLVFGTLHTSTAISTIARIVDVFPPEQQNQIKMGLCDTLKGVISQTLCKRIGGGRIAALEILVVTIAIANLIREGKTNQIMSSMQTGKAQGNMLLNEELAKLVKLGKVDVNEALQKSVDKDDIGRRLNIV